MMPLGIFTLWTIFLLFCNSDAATQSDPIVTTNVGVIRGLNSPDGDYTMFMGIPFAQVNASNPFGKAVPQEPFDDIFEAFDDSAICPQIEEFNLTTVGSLDCMHINVYVPSTVSTENPAPVYAYIYGGGFSIGFAGRFLYGPKYFMRHDIILVTFNYRLGPYGFMCLNTPEVPGNEGFKDQLLALRWINENIGAFGGDPSKITIGGQSAGGMSADFHILSLQEKLFDKAILQSGTAQAASYIEPMLDAPQILARHLGLVTDDVGEAISFLAQVDPFLVIETTSELGLRFMPCVEKSFDGVESFINEDWLRRDAIPKVKNMSILVGFTDDEVISMLANGVPSVNINAFSNTLAPKFDTSASKFDGMADIVRRFYLGDEEVNGENAFSFVDFNSDFSFVYPTYSSVARYLDNDAADTYLYLFSYVGGRNFIRRMNNITIGGVAHADELGYMFDFSIYEETPTEDDQLMIDRMTDMWANFIKYGNPTPDTSDLLPVKWNPIRKGSPYYYLNIGAELTTGTRPYHRRMSFWDLFFRTNGDLMRTHPGTD